VADQLGVQFFEYALAKKAERDAANEADLSNSQQIDLSGFERSPFCGDFMNQEIFDAREKGVIPKEFFVPLPSKAIADAWDK
jgi:hypothetical protein